MPITKLLRPARQRAGASRPRRALTLVNACQEVVLASADERSLLERTCRTIIEVADYRCAWVGYAAPDAPATHRPVCPVVQAGLRGQIGVLANVLRAHPNEELVGAAINSGARRVANRLSTSRQFAALRGLAARLGVASGAAFPLATNGQVVGAIGIYSARPDAFDAYELELLDGIVRLVSYGLLAVRLREERDLLRLRMERALYFDALTVLPNHLHFESRLRKQLEPLRQGRRIGAVVTLGLDRMSELNDALGFEQGDRVLREFAQRLRDFARRRYLVARLRGNKFGLLLPLNETSEVFDVLKRLLSAVQAPIMIGELELDVRLCIGVSLFPADHTDATALIRAAIIAMHQARKQGRAYALYEPEQDAAGRRRVGMAVQLKRAIEGDQLLLHYQPKVDMRSRRCCGVEALVRWSHPSRGLIPPDEFIAHAEQSGLIGALTEWVLAAAWRDREVWRGAGLHLPIAINLSAHNLRDTEMIDKIQEYARRSSSPWLELEITEGAVIEDPEVAIRSLKRLSDQGVQLFVDDFGVGYSTFGYLKQLPVSGVKIDKSFVIDMLTNAESATIVRSMIGMAHGLNKTIVAEGVESQAVWDRLAQMGCDHAQGYHISRPLPAEQLLAFVERTAPGDRREMSER